jgi:hypothetical protein
MKMLLSGSAAHLKAISKIAKGFRGVTCETITEEGDSTPSPSIVDSPADTTVGEETKTEVVDAELTQGSETSVEDEGTEETETPESSDKKNKGKNKNKR